MIRKLVNWLLRTLHIRRRQDKSALVSMIELLPVLFVMMTIVTITKFIAGELPLRVRIWLKIRYYVRYARAAVIGY